jgi:hypothetical protein
MATATRSGRRASGRARHIWTPREARERLRRCVVDELVLLAGVGRRWSVIACRDDSYGYGWTIGSGITPLQAVAEAVRILHELDLHHLGRGDVWRALSQTGAGEALR